MEKKKDYVAELLVKLVAVGLKEASMDSPSFRASMNHMHISIVSVSQSLTLLSNHFESYSKLLRSVQLMKSDLQDAWNPFLTSFLNKDIVVPAVELSVKGSTTMIDSIENILSLDESKLVGIREIIDKDIPKYFKIRKSFDAIQQKYDHFLAKYLQLPFTQSSITTHEYAIQLFEIRKQYVHLSMSLWVAIKVLESKMGFGIIKASVATVGWSANEEIVKFLKLGNVVSEVKRLHKCANELNKSGESLFKILNDFRKSSEEILVGLITPSNDLTHFEGSRVLPAESLNDEKHGWVYIKSGTIWIKRWMFVKDHMFGFLNISSDGQFVEESDKFGVLVVNIKQTLHEDRKFCLQLIGTVNLIIQVETYKDLSNWLGVFKKSQQLAKEKKSPYASCRIEPIMDSIKLHPATAIDTSLILSESIDYKPDPTIERMKELMNAKMSSLHYRLSINPPIETSATLYSILSNLYMTSSSVPSAARANFWGYTNWGLRNISNNEIFGRMFNNKSIEARSAIDLRYPDCYTEELKIIDFELRALFETFVPRDEFALMRFNGTWSPNSQQTLFCNFYVTANSFYVYTNNCGLISSLPLKLSSFLHTEADGNILRIYYISGISIKLVIGDAGLVRDIINYILQARRKADTSINDYISEIKKIRQSYNELCLNEDPNLLQIQTQPASIENEPEISDDMHLLWNRQFNVPSKALFHILFGNDSHLLQCTLPLATYTDNKTRHTLWRCDHEQKLTRVVWSKIFKIPCAKQTIDYMFNNKYYSITQETPNLKLVFGITQKITICVVIQSLDSKSSRLLVYQKHQKNTSSWFTKAIMRQIMIFRLDTLETQLNEAVKELPQSSKIAFAVKHFGGIIKWDGDEPTADELSFKNTVSFIPLQLFSMFYYEKINYEMERILHQVLKLIIYWISNSADYFSKAIGFINANLIIISVLTLSVILNLILGSMSTSAWWRERNIAKSIQPLRQPVYALGWEDIDNILSHSELLSIPDELRILFQDQVGLGFGKQRYELIEELRRLNGMEKEWMKGEWKIWIGNEWNHCNELGGRATEIGLGEYCHNVTNVMVQMKSGSLLL
ncbi:Sip3 protein [Martiniozyma asiatica (nom. inval.)]|nr:Sip3 protein [Martiniozyma asiatica]